MKARSRFGCAVLLACCTASAYCGVASGLGGTELKGPQGAAKASGAMRDIDANALKLKSSPPNMPKAIGVALTKIPELRLASGDILWPVVNATRLRGSYMTRLDSPAKNPQFVNLMPRDEQSFLAVYGQTFTEARSQQLKRYFRRLEQVDPVAKTLNNEASIARFLSDAGDSAPVVFFGHSGDSGTILVLSSGERLSAERLHTMCERANRACLVLTCDGQDFRLRGKVTLDDAVDTWSALRSLANTESLTVGEFRDVAITLAAERSKRPGAWAISSVAALAGEGYFATHRFEYVQGPKKIRAGDSVRGLQIPKSVLQEANR